jgi:uncharacterized protein YdeI (YjbR/CyaY-like superfamily)
MAPLKSQEFRAVLEATGTSLHWVIARIPLDLKKTWPSWAGRRVRGEINGFAFRTALFPGPKGKGHTLLVNKRMQAGAKAGPGSAVRIRLEPDMDPPTISMPAELASELKRNRPLLRWFERLSPSMQKGLTQLVDQAKGTETRRKRAANIAETLMLTMEGEAELPPILKAAFQRQPLTQEGWNAMTAIQRRNHLLGIFYVQTVDGRNRRAAKVVEDCLRIARRTRD